MRFLHQLTALFATAALLCVFTACQKEIDPLNDQEPVDSAISAIDSSMLIKKLRIYDTDPSSDIFDGKDSMVFDFHYDTLNKQIVSNSEEGIGVYAFNTDSNLTKIKVGTTMADIVDYMSFDYDNNKNLKKVTVVYDENITYSIDFKTTIQGSLKIIDAIDTAFADERGGSDKLGEWRFVVNDKDQLTEMQHSKVIETIDAKRVRISKFTYLSDGSLSAYNVSGYDSSLTNGAKTSLQAYSATYHTRAQAGTQMAQLFKIINRGIANTYSLMGYRHIFLDWLEGIGQFYNTPMLTATLPDYQSSSSSWQQISATAKPVIDSKGRLTNTDYYISIDDSPKWTKLYIDYYK